MHREPRVFWEETRQPVERGSVHTPARTYVLVPQYSIHSATSTAVVYQDGSIAIIQYCLSVLLQYPFVTPPSLHGMGIPFVVVGNSVIGSLVRTMVLSTGCRVSSQNTHGSRCTCVPFSNQKVVTLHYKYVRKRVRTDGRYVPTSFPVAPVFPVVLEIMMYVHMYGIRTYVRTYILLCYIYPYAHVY